MRRSEESRTILIGAASGALVGAVLAVLYGRWRQQRRVEGAKPIQPGQVLRLGTALVPIVRQIVELLS